MKQDNKIKWELPPTRYRIGVCDLMLKANHILIAGTTGAGKSTLIENLLYTIMSTNTPAQARFILIDPKRVQFNEFSRLPFVERHIKDLSEIIPTLQAVESVMVKRLYEMERNRIKEYNGKYLYIVIDELADIMTDDTIKKEFMRIAQRIGQLGRAPHIKLICATQCPNREIIPAKLTVNFNGRVGLRCQDRIESRQIIKHNGAELLPKWGKCLYLHDDGYLYSGEIPYMPADISNLIDFWLKQGDNSQTYIKTPVKASTSPKKPHTAKYTILDALRGNRLVMARKEDEHKTAPDSIEIQNILSLIDDD